MPEITLSNLVSTKKNPAYFTLFESENERQKIEPVPILLPRASRNFPDAKQETGKKSIYKYIIGLQR